MGMVIKNNLDSVRTYNIYNRNTIALSNSMYKVSSGQRINTAADGASDLAISERMRGRIRSVDQANRNTQNGLNMVKTASGALSNMTDILNTMRERLVNAANDTNTSIDRSYLKTELDGLMAEIDQLSQATYNGKNLLDGTWADDTSGLVFQIGAEASDTFNVNIGSMDSTSLGLAEVIVDDLVAEAAAGNDGSYQTEKITAAIGSVDAALNTVLETLTELGSYENRLGYVSDGLATESENLQASESTIRDQDIAKGMADFMKYNVLTQASQFMLAQAGQNAYSVLNLLQQ